MRVESTVRKLLPYTSAGLALALLYAGWTLFSRWNDNRAIEQSAAAQKAKADTKIVEMFGSGSLKILNFYVTSRVIPRGQKGLLCYGVSNAQSVRIEPGVEPVKPSIGRCIEIAPQKDTTYTLKAEDAAGHSEAKSLLVRVQ